VSIEAVLPATDSDGVIVRLCEVAGARGEAFVTVDLPFTSATRVDLLERERTALDVDGSTIVVSLTPFELVTLLLR
jgi:alpha-mannosidase